MIFYTRILPLLLLAIAAFIALYYWKKNSTALKIAAIICLLNFVSELVGNIMSVQNIKNAWLYNISDVSRYLLWFSYFFFFFTNQYQKRYALFLAVTFSITYLAVNFFQSIIEFQTISFIAGGIMLLSCCFIFLYNEYQSNSTENIRYNPHFWISLGLLIYYALNLPFIGLYNWLFKHAAQFSKIYFYICVMGSSLLLSIFMIKAFTCNRLIKKSGT
jgi:hypothetical protein